MGVAKFELDISGGLNDALPATQILPFECSVNTNVDYSQNPQGSTRKGHTKVATSRYKNGSSVAFRMLGLTSFAYGPGTFRDIFLGLAASDTVKLYYVASFAATQVSWATGITATNAAYPFSFATLRNHLLMVNGSNPNASWNGDTARAAQTLGIAAPSTALTASSGAAGTLNGIYRWIPLFYDSTSDVYSAAGPASTALTLTDKQVTFSSVPVSTNPRVNQRHIFRTGSTGQPPYYLETVIADNTTTTGSSNVADSDTTTASGADRVLLAAGGQPDNCRFAIAFNGVIYLMNSPSGEKYARVYASRPNRPEEFPATYQFDLGTGDGQMITGAWVVGNQLVVFKERSIWHITGTDRRDRNTQQMNDKVGMKWPYAGIQLGGRIVFAAEDGIYEWDTATIRKVSNERGIFPAQGTWDAIGNIHPSNNIGDEVRMAYLEGRRQILVAYRTTANSGANDRLLCWNPYQPHQSWSKYDFGFDCHGDWRANYSNKKTLVFFSRDATGWILRADDGNMDRVSAGGTVQGTVSAGTATTLTITGTLDTAGEGLIDAYVWVKSATTDAEQTAKIASNTATVITVSSWPTFTPASGDTWAVGSIQTQFKSARQMLGEPNIEKELITARVRIESAA